MITFLQRLQLDLYEICILISGCSSFAILHHRWKLRFWLSWMSNWDNCKCYLFSRGGRDPGWLTLQLQPDSFWHQHLVTFSWTLVADLICIKLARDTLVFLQTNSKRWRCCGAEFTSKTKLVEFEVFLVTEERETPTSGHVDLISPNNLQKYKDTDYFSMTMEKLSFIDDNDDDRTWDFNWSFPTSNATLMKRPSEYCTVEYLLSKKNSWLSCY